MGRTTADNVLHACHWAHDSSLDTGQTEDDAFKPKPIDPELDDSKTLTGKPIQPYLSLVGQLQWLVTLGVLSPMHKSLHCPCSGQPQGNYKGLVIFLKKTIYFHLIQSNYYLSEMLSKYWDLIKILPRISKLHMTYGSTPFYIAHAQVNSKAATRDLWLCQKDHYLQLDPVQSVSQ